VGNTGPETKHRDDEAVMLYLVRRSARGEHVRYDVTTNHAEGYFSQSKRSIDGTHHKVSTEHLNRCLEV
jgi:hypothetical protein